MCGIFGALGRDASLLRQHERAIHSVIHHRGPDDEGFFEQAHVALGFNRLSILDLSPAGHQPMVDTSGRYALVFNGEIFNYKELAQRLPKDIILRGSSDSEILLNLLIQFGSSICSSLNGMYAFCFVDTMQKKAILCRDRFGIKPLYYAVHNQTLYFGSELKALLQIPDISREIDQSSLMHYWGLGYTSNDASIFQSVRRFTPACFAVWWNR